MQKWQYGMALYSRKPNEQHARIDCRGSVLAMKDIDEIQTQTGLLQFLKVAGEKGWELCSSIAPWPEGQQLSEESEDSAAADNEYIVEDRFEIQWIIFKRPV